MSLTIVLYGAAWTALPHIFKMSLAMTPIRFLSMYYKSVYLYHSNL